MIIIDNLSPAALETYKATRKAMYLVLARMHDMGMNPDIEKAQDNEILSVNTFMLGQAFIGNDPKLKVKNPLDIVLDERPEATPDDFDYYCCQAIGDR